MKPPYSLEKARGSDGEALLDLLYKTFHNRTPTHPRFEFLYPDLFLPTDEAMGRHWVIRDDSGRPVSCVGAYPTDFQLGPARIRAVGIGQVATDPDHAGQGMMHALMQAAMAEMKQSHASLGWLGGRHDRYGKYGWDWGGSGMRFNLDAKSIGSAPAGWTVREGSGTEAEFERIWAQREAHPVRGLCSRADWLLRSQRCKAQTWVAEKGVQTAFAVFNPGWRCLQEWGGDPAGLLALSAKLAEAGALTMLVHPEFEPQLDLFRAKSTGASVGLGMLSVLNLDTLAREFGPFIKARLPADRALRLAIREEGREVTAVTLTGSRAKGEPLTVALDRPRMTGFLFGPVRASCAAGLPDSARWVDQLFPLPFVVPALFSV